MLICAIFLVVNAQEYAFIDQTLSNPVLIKDTVLQSDISKKLFPVEKNELISFKNALAAIQDQLKENNPKTPLVEFKTKSVTIKGRRVHFQDEIRFAYIMTFKSQKVSAIYLLCDAKRKNTTNAFIVNTWVKYLDHNIQLLDRPLISITKK